MKPIILCAVAVLFVTFASGCCHHLTGGGVCAAPAGSMYGMAAPAQSASLAPIATGGTACNCQPY